MTKNTITEKVTFWKDMIVVYDTSALLNLYKLSEGGQHQLFKKLFSNFESKLHIPGTVYEEFVNGESKIKNQNIDSYKNLLKLSKDAENIFKQIENKIKNPNQHPILDDDNISKILDYLNAPLNDFVNSVKEKINEFEEPVHVDEVHNLISSLFILHDPISFTDKIKMIEEGERRFLHKVPPGYMDVKKDSIYKFNDYYIWMEVLAIAKSKKAPVLLITDDIKNDWWNTNKSNKRDGPRIELIKEFKDITGNDFWAFTTEEFIKQSDELFDFAATVPIVAVIAALTQIYKSSNDVDILSINENSDDDWRVDRIKEVISKDYLSTIIGRIESLHDHEGTLEVIWKYEPSKFDKYYLERAWREVGESEVSHESS